MRNSLEIGVEINGRWHIAHIMAIPVYRYPFIVNIERIFQCAGQNDFKQSDVMEYLNCSKSKAGNLISAMKQAGVIKKVTGKGLGVYQFV